MMQNFYYSKTPYKKYKGNWNFRCINCGTITKVSKEQKGSYYVWNPQLGYPFSIFTNQFLVCSIECCKEGMERLKP